MKTKRKAIGLMAVMAVLAVGVGVSEIAKTEYVANADTAETEAKFEMYEGASVRIATEEDGTGSGIRFGSYITEAYFATLSEATNVTLESTVSATVGGEEKSLTQSWVLKGEDSITMSYNANGEMKFWHAIMFDDLIKSGSANMTVASALDLTGTMKLIVDGEDVATDNASTINTTRSARIVAYEAYTGAYSSDKTLKAYFGNAEEAVTLDSADEYVFLEDGAEKLTPTWGNDATKSDLDLYDGVEKIGVNKEFTAADFTALGEKKALVAFDADNKPYNVTAMYVTKVLTEIDDFRTFQMDTDNAFYDETASTCAVTGYYVLGNDIAYDESWVSNVHSFTSGYFSGTFDGLGHTMEFNAQAGGLFNSLQYGGTVKNVAAICHLKTGTGSDSTVGTMWSPFAGNMGSGATSKAYLHNTYIKIKEVDYRPSGSGNYCGWFAITSSFNVYSEVHNVIAELDSSINTFNTKYAGTFWMLGGENTGSEKEKETDNIYCIGLADNLPIGGRQIFAAKSAWITNWAANDTAENWEKYSYYNTEITHPTNGNVTKVSDFVQQESEVFRFGSLEEMTTDTTYGATQVGNWKVTASGVEWTDDVVEEE